MANDKDFKVKNGLQLGGAFIEKVGTVTGSATLDLSTGNVFEVIATEDITLAFDNQPSVGSAQEFIMSLNNNAIPTSYDIINAVPPAQLGKLSVAAQEGQPEGVFFKPDGTKMYIVGSFTRDVFEYNLSTPWDASTASFVFNIDTFPNDSSPRDIFFKPDGTEMYIAADTSDQVHQYSLSAAWEIATATLTKSYNVSNLESNIHGLFFKPDGTKMYIIGTLNDTVWAYNLSTAWDVTTASYAAASFNVAAQDTIPSGIFFKPDGLKMYIAGDQQNIVREYNLSTAWDINTASYSTAFNVSSQASNPVGLFFKPDGLKMYVLDRSQDTLSSYTLSTAWNISTASYVLPTEGYFSVSAQDGIPQDVFFKPDGTKMYTIGDLFNSVSEYNLSTAWEVSTASHLQNFSVAAQDGNPSGIFFKPDGLKMYVSGYSLDNIYEYNLSTAWNISTASFFQSFSVSAQDNYPLGVVFKTDGTKMYVIGLGGDAVYEYNLSTAWNVSTASYLQGFSVFAQETSPTGMFFKPDGTRMFVIGGSGRDINEYSLSTAWNVSTASYLQNFSVANEEISPNGVFFGDNGNKMYITGSINDAVWQYSTGTTGGIDVTYPASIKWPSGTVPDAPASGETDLIAFYTDDGGTTYYGIQRGDNMS